MGWVSPRTYTVGEIITKAILDTHIKDNLNYLKGVGQVPTIQSGLIIDSALGTEYLRIPSLTTIQRDAIASPVAGMLIYNSTTTQFNKYENGAWRSDLGFNSHHGDLSGLTDDDHTQYQKENLLTTAGDLPYATEAGVWTRLDIGTAGQFLRTNSGATAPEWQTGGLATVVRKTADEIVNNSLTLQDDDHLFCAIAANENWGFEFVLCFEQGDDTTAEVKVAVTVPSGIISYGGSWETAGGTSAVDQNATWGSGIPLSVDMDANSRKIIVIKGFALNGATPGNMCLQWAQVVATAIDTTLKRGSHLIAHNMA